MDLGTGSWEGWPYGRGEGGGTDAPAEAPVAPEDLPPPMLLPGTPADPDPLLSKLGLWMLLPPDLVLEVGVLSFHRKK